jgi:hypothetical protein
MSSVIECLQSGEMVNWCYRPKTDCGDQMFDRLD